MKPSSLLPVDNRPLLFRPILHIYYADHLYHCPEQNTTLDFVDVLILMNYYRIICHARAVDAVGFPCDVIIWDTELTLSGQVEEYNA